jgi:hypothetical protein
MSKKEEEFVFLFEELENSKSEEEVYQSLKRILKESSSVFYKSKILNNPYFKSLVVDVREDVLSEIRLIRKSLKEEIQSIDDEIVILLSKDKNNPSINKFKSLKRDCISLVYEIDDRKKDIINLI